MNSTSNNPELSERDAAVLGQELSPSVSTRSENSDDVPGRVQDYDRSAERRYESWLETIKDHGP